MAIKLFVVALFATTVFSVSHGKNAVEVKFCGKNCAEPCAAKQFTDGVCLKNTTSDNKDYWWRYTGAGDCTGKTEFDFTVYNSEGACNKGRDGVTVNEKSFDSGCMGQNYITGTCNNDQITYTFCTGADECTCGKNAVATSGDCAQGLKLSCESDTMHFVACGSTINAETHEASSCTATSHFKTEATCDADGTGKVSLSTCGSSGCGSGSCGTAKDFETKKCIEHNGKFWYLPSCIPSNGKFVFKEYDTKEDCERHNSIVVKLSQDCSAFGSATAACVPATESTTTEGTTESTEATTMSSTSSSSSASGSPDAPGSNNSSDNTTSPDLSGVTGRFSIVSAVFLGLVALVYTL